ncbi:MAG TPA: hypothetical protein VN969_19900 [Streptosporangiaceae bacterium]|jgi:hypothetical protein|nr:hypothetical protein [Streptosporangiaceae bacterium]
MTKPAVRSKNPVAAHPWVSAAIGILVFGSIFCTLFVPIYARITPKVGEFPFFYFYLLAYMLVVTIALLVVIALQKHLGSNDGGEPR